MPSSPPTFTRVYIYSEPPIIRTILLELSVTDFIGAKNMLRDEIWGGMRTFEDRTVCALEHVEGAEGAEGTMC